MPDECNHLCFCPIEGIIDVISKKWALLIINALCNRGKLRFNDLMKELGGISPKTLSDTLKELQVEKLITRQSFAEIPPRVEYSLTKDGIELGKAIMPLIKWAATRQNDSKRCASVCQGTPAHRIVSPTVPNPTELLTGLAEGIQVAEPMKRELRKESAARIKKKASRTVQ